MANVDFEFNLTITQGDDRVLDFVFWEDEERTIPLDISTWGLFYTAKADITDIDGDAAIALDPSDFSLVTSTGSGAVVNRALATIPKASTAAMAAISHPHDLQRVVGGVVTTLGRGQLVINAQVTQRTA